MEVMRRTRPGLANSSLIRSFVAVIVQLILLCHAASAATYRSYQQPTLGRQSFFGMPSKLTVHRKTSELCPASKHLFVRGGATRNDDEYDDEEDEESEFEDDDEDFAFDFEDGGGVAESEFAEDNIVEQVWSAWKKTPPLTKGYLAASIAATMYGYVLNKNEFPAILMLDWNKVMTRLQIWRPLTSFLNFGPFGIGYLLTAQFVWVYMSTLERLNHARPYDFWIMILFGQLSMVIGYPLLKLSPRFLGHNLSTFLVYIWSRYHEGVQVNMFELFNTRAEMLPWFFLAQTFLLEGEPPVLDFLGIVFGHIYHHSKTVGILRAPESVTEWYETSTSSKAIRDLYKPISSDFDAV